MGNSPSPIIFVITVITLTLSLNKTMCSYEISKGAGRISHLLHLDDLKLYGKTDAENESRLQGLWINSKEEKLLKLKEYN